MKDHDELYDKTNEHFKDKTRKECLWEQFGNSHNVVCVCKTWFDSQRTCCAIKVWTGPEGDDTMTELDKGQVWIPKV